MDKLGKVILIGGLIVIGVTILGIGGLCWALLSGGDPLPRVIVAAGCSAGLSWIGTAFVLSR